MEGRSTNNKCYHHSTCGRQDEDAPAHAALSSGAHSARHLLELVHIHLCEENKKSHKP
jgi:hypothetical protein